MLPKKNLQSQKPFYFQTKFILFAFTVLAFTGWQTGIFSSPSFERRTFTGKSSYGTTIALSIKASNGKVTGSGFHKLSNGKLRRVFLDGSIGLSSKVSFKESISNSTYGYVKGRFDKDCIYLNAIWTDKNGQDPTQIELSHTERTPDEILAEITPTLGKKIGTSVDDGLKEIGEWITAFKNSL